MSRRLGEYVPLSVNYPNDDAILSLATPLAEVLFVRCLALAKSLRSDGYLTEAQVLARAGHNLGSPVRIRALIKELVKQRLWVATDGGYVIRSFLKWNQSAEELGMERARDRDRKRVERTSQDTLWNDLDQEEQDPVRVDTARTPGGRQADSSQNPQGDRVDSAPRAPARAGAPCVVPSTDRSNVTALHSTARNGVAGIPPETIGQRVNRLARIYTDQVPICKFIAVAGIVRKAVNANLPDDVIIDALNKIVSENRSLTAETLRRAIYGSPRAGPSTGDQRVLEAQALKAQLRAERGEPPRPELPGSIAL